MSREDTPLLHPNHTSLAPYQIDDRDDIINPSSYQSTEIHYLLLMGAMGGVTGLTTISITTFADKCNTTALSIGVIFIFQAIGALIGSIMSIWLFVHTYKHIVLLCSGLFLAYLLLYITSISSMSVLCMVFIVLGMFHMIVQIGCISLLRKRESHCQYQVGSYGNRLSRYDSDSDSNDNSRDGRSSGGYWMALTQVAYGIGAFLFVLLYSISSSTDADFYVLGFVCVLMSVSLIVYMNPEDNLKSISNGSIHPIHSTSRSYHTQSEIDQQQHQPNIAEKEEDYRLNSDDSSKIVKIPTEPVHYNAEMLVGLTLLLIHGMSLSVTAYLSTFAEETSASSTTTANYQVSVFWLAVCIGRIIGMIDQWKLVNRGSFVLRISVWATGACICALFWFAIPYDVYSIWVCVSLMGFLSGPTTGYCLDLLHDMTIPAETSTAAVLMITNVGGLIVTYVCAAIWNAGAGALTLVYISFIGLLLSTPFVWFARGMSYIPEKEEPKKPLSLFVRPFY